jgi:hypothetical protein
MPNQDVLEQKPFDQKFYAPSLVIWNFAASKAKQKAGLNNENCHRFNAAGERWHKSML